MYSPLSPQKVVFYLLWLLAFASFGCIAQWYYIWFYWLWESEFKSIQLLLSTRRKWQRKNMLVLTHSCGKIDKLWQLIKIYGGYIKKLTKLSSELWNITFWTCVGWKWSVMNWTIVERMLEYQQAWGIKVPQCFNCRPWSKLKLVSIWQQTQNILFYVLERELFIVNDRFKIFHHVM